MWMIIGGVLMLIVLPYIVCGLLGLGINAAGRGIKKTLDK
jgi:hypothetical protein